MSAIGRITGAKLGSAGVGPPLVLAGLGGRIANKWFGDKTNSEIIRVLSRAFRDKDFATLLIKPLSDDVAEQVINRLNRFLQDDKALLTTGVRIGAETMEDEVNVNVPLEYDKETRNINIPAVNQESRMAQANPMGMIGTPAA